MAASLFSVQCDRFGLNRMLGGEIYAMFVPAGARERNSLSVIVRDFVIIARGERDRECSQDK